MKLLRRLLEHLIAYPLSFAVRRKPKRWVFGAPDGRFEGNSKYLFLWISRFAPQIEATWLTRSDALIAKLRSHGLRVEKRRSWSGIKKAATAEFYFVNSNGDDIDFALSGGSKVFNLWHGVGIKNILRKSSVGLNAKLFSNRWMTPFYLLSLQRFKLPYYVLSTSTLMSTHFAECFGVPRSRCLPLGYPRQDPSFEPEFAAYCDRIDASPALKDFRSRFKEIYVYAPTLRQKAPTFIVDAIPDFGALSSVLHARDALLLIKLHPRDHSSVDEACRDYGNIFPWPVETDFYSNSALLDGLITDYSSLLYDWIEHRDRGVILYPFDYDRFVADERDLAFPYRPNVIGEWAPDFQSLCTAIQSGEGIAPLPHDQLRTLRTRFWGDSRTRGPASAQIVHHLTS